MIANTHPRITLALAAVGAAVLVAGCGGGKSPSQGANSGRGGPQNGVSAAYKYSRCMRLHGVSDFPDPKVRVSGNSVEVGIRVTPGLTGSPQFKTAQKACQSIVGGPGQLDGRTPAQQQARERGLISFANCMRSHQVPTFPDPTTDGQISPQMLAAANIDLKAPAVRSAAIDCVPASEGQLTKAQVEQALGQP